FMTEADFNRTTTTLLEHMELKPDLGQCPITDIVDAPPTLYNLDRKVRYMSLAEAIAISIESGRVGQPSFLFPGSALDNLVQFSGGGSIFGGVNGSDAIRVFALQPAVFGNQIEAAVSKFDAHFSSSMQWQTRDEPNVNSVPNSIFPANNQVQNA